MGSAKWRSLAHLHFWLQLLSVSGPKGDPAPFHVRLLFLEIVAVGCVCWLGSMPRNASTYTGVLFQNWCFPTVY